MEAVMEGSQPVSQRKQRITKRQSQEFIRWFQSNTNVQDLSISGIINEYNRLTNVMVSRMYVSNVRKAVKDAAISA